MMIKNFILSAQLLLAAGMAYSQTAPKPYGVLPTERQIKWQETEMYCIVHFSMATFDDKEWGYGDEPNSLFNPQSFNALQIVGAAKAGGFKGIVVVAKHHDGFCLWPTKTTQHNISQSPYKNGKGDVVKEYQEACEKLNMKLGLYCSPWDRNNANYGTPEYVNIYRAQLKELYSNYGPLFMSWHDGANGGDGFYGGAREPRKIDRTTYYGWDTNWGITRAMQPTAAIFGDVGPDVRWVGNEQGHAGETSWETYTPEAPEEGKTPANGFVKDWLGTEGTRNGKYWMPAECDVPLRTGWFYHQSQDGQSKSAYKLLDLYYKSVGRAACLDLGLSPNKQGFISPEDEQILKEFGNILKQTFAVNLAKGATLTASNVRGKNQAVYGVAHLTDNDRYSYWATDDQITNPQLIVDMHKPQTFNVIRLREDIKLGQRIEGVAIDIWQNNAWQQLATATSIGANRLIRLPQNVTASKVRLRVTKSPVCIALSDFGLFKEPAHLSAPQITRTAKGEVSLTTEAPVSSIHYTVDSSTPGLTSSTYQHPFLLTDGGVVKALSFENANQHSEIKSAQFGPVKVNWQIKTGDKNLIKAIDDNPGTYAEIPVSAGEGIVVDLGKSTRIKEFTYLPKTDHTDGMVDAYEFYYSVDGSNWIKAQSGEFANIKSNPVMQFVKLDKPVEAQYIKFIPKHVIHGDIAEVAELGIITQ
jgi:alpha-L-fucosidase